MVKKIKPDGSVRKTNKTDTYLIFKKKKSSIQGFSKPYTI